MSAEAPASRLSASAWPKQCRCGAVFTAETWRALTLCGYMEDGLGGRLELRHCIACGSTIAVKAATQTA